MMRLTKKILLLCLSGLMQQGFAAKTAAVAKKNKQAKAQMPQQTAGVKAPVGAQQAKVSAATKAGTPGVKGRGGKGKAAVTQAAAVPATTSTTTSAVAKPVVVAAAATIAARPLSTGTSGLLTATEKMNDSALESAKAALQKLETGFTANAGTPSMSRDQHLAGAYYRSYPTYTFPKVSEDVPLVLHFRAKGTNDIHIGLKDSSDAFVQEIVLFGWGGVRSCVRRGPQNDEFWNSDGKNIKKLSDDQAYTMIINRKTGVARIFGASDIMEFSSNDLKKVASFSLSNWNTPIEYSNVVAGSFSLLSGFEPEGGMLLEIAVGSKTDGTAIIVCIGVDGILYSYEIDSMDPGPWAALTPSDTSGKPFSAGKFISISAANDGTMCVVAANGYVYFATISGNKMLLNGCSNLDDNGDAITIRQVTVANAQNVFVQATSNGTEAIYSFNGKNNNWTKIGSAGIDMTAGIDDKGNVEMIAINTQHKVFKYLGGSRWEKITDSPMDSVHRCGHKLYALHNGELFQLNWTSKMFLPVLDVNNNPIVGVRDLASNGAATFLVTMNNSVYNNGDDGVTMTKGSGIVVPVVSQGQRAQAKAAPAQSPEKQKLLTAIKADVAATTANVNTLKKVHASGKGQKGAKKAQAAKAATTAAVVEPTAAKPAVAKATNPVTGNQQAGAGKVAGQAKPNAAKGGKAAKASKAAKSAKTAATK